MNDEPTIDWESWEVETVPSDFVDRVMNAALAESHRSSLVRRLRRAPRWMTMLGAAALAGGSLTALAMIGRNLGRREPQPTAAQPGATGSPAGAAANGPARASRDGAHEPPKAQYAAGTVVDRKLRDNVRARIVAPLTEQGVERDPHTGLTVPVGSNGPSHNLSREYLQARIRQDFYPLAKACYEGALAKEPNLSGQIVVDFMIVGDAKVGGIVDQAEVNERTDIADKEFTSCMRESMLSMVFAPPDNNGWVTVTYPFKFSPEDDEDRGH